MPRWSRQFRPQLDKVRAWLDEEEFDHSRELLAGYYDHTAPFRGASFDKLAGTTDPFKIEPADLDAIRALSIHPSRAFISLLAEPAFQVSVDEPLRQLPLGVALEDLTQRDFDRFLEPLSPGWDLWEILVANMRASKTREFNVGASKLCSTKRPELIPIEDSLVRRILRVNRYGVWRVLYELVTDAQLRDSLERLRNSVPRAGPIPLHRLLDVVAWRRARSE